MLMSPTAAVLFLLLAWAGPGQPTEACAAGILQLESDRASYALGPYLEVLEDKAGLWTIDDVHAPRLSGRFSACPKDTLNLGISTSVFWIRFTVAPPKAKPAEGAASGPWLLDIRNYKIDSVSLYTRPATNDLAGAAKAWLVEHRDLRAPLPAGESLFEHLLLPLPSHLDTPRTFFLRIDSRNSLFLPLTICTRDAYQKRHTRDLLSMGFYYGIMLIIIIYNLILLVTLRERSRLYYILYVIFTALYFAWQNALSMEYIFRTRPDLDYYFGHLSLGLLMLFILLFSRDFLNTKRSSLSTDRVLLSLVISLAAYIILIPFGSHLLIPNLAVGLGLIVSVALLITGFLSLRSGFRPARYYLASFVLFLSGAFLYALNYAGILTNAISTAHSFQVCSALQVILLSIAMADQISELRRQTDVAHAETAQALTRTEELNVELQELARTLEEKVQARTSDLQHALLRLEEMATTDSLTGIFNRRKFNEILQDEINRCQRYHRPLALIIFDIDLFKQINDTYGHQVGDAVLRDLAQTVRANIRGTNILARWGGEEFMVVAPETNIAAAGCLAEKIRRLVDGHTFADAGNVTISLGVTAYAPPDTPDSMMMRVDNALYRAKQNGRNRVEIAS